MRVPLLHRVPEEIRWLLGHVRPFLGLQAVRLSTLLATTVLALIDPLILKWLIDDILPWNKPSMLPVAAGAFFFVYFFRLVLGGISDLLDFYAGQRVGLDIRLELLRHLQSLSAGYHESRSVGDTLYRIEQDVGKIQHLGGALAASLVRVGITTCMTLAVMLLMSWKLTLCMLPLIPLLLWLRHHSFPLLRGSSEAVQERSGKLSGFLQDHLAAITQVQLLNREITEARRFVQHSRHLLSAHVRRRLVELVFGLAPIVLIVAATAFVLGFGGYQVLTGAFTVGGLVAFYTYLSRLFDPLRGVVDLYSQLQRASASIRRILEVLDVEPAVADRPGAVALAADTPGVVEIHRVAFAYQTTTPILRDISLCFQPGEKVALVGESGCGKSTFARLLVRLYEVVEGCVLIDGTDLRQLRLRDLRTRVALLPQDPVIFDTTLEENLLYGNPKAGEVEMDEALVMVQLEELIARLPAGRREPVGPHGARLSGGERQRLALARVVLQRPRVLILDEATSSLDGPTETRLLSAMEEFLSRRTTILIAHRLSAILRADRIHVLDGGRIVESGTHPELYRAGGLYRRLCDEQFRHADGSGGMDGTLPAPVKIEVSRP